jgi:hypothetical protein
MPDAIEQLNESLAGRYAIERELGRGGMATVYLARDLRHERPVALKVLRSDLAAAVGAGRFLREIRITAGLNHPHILPLLDSGDADGLVYYVVPYEEGGSLRQKIVGQRRLPLGEVVDIVGQVAAALDYAHRRGVVHRDIKPENILFSDGHAIVSDFGIAKAISEATSEPLTRTGFPIGTLGYLSPEQAAGRTDVDGRVDVYSLASVAYEMLVGETPGIWPTEESLRLGRLVDAPEAHREMLDLLPGRVEQVLIRGMALRPAKRFSTPGEFATALGAVSQHGTGLSDAEVEQLLGRAADLDAGSPADEAGAGGSGGALTIGAVEQVAAQVGIPPARVREAARDLNIDRPPAGLEAGSGSQGVMSPGRATPPGYVPGLPQRLWHQNLDIAPGEPGAPPGRTPRGWVELYKNTLYTDRVVQGELPVSSHPVLVQEIQRRLRIPGHMSTVGRSLTWSPAAQGEEGRRIAVTTTTWNGRTEIHIEERIELTGWKQFAPGYGGAAGAAFALMMVLGLGLAGGAIVVPALIFGIAGAILTVQSMIIAMAEERKPELLELGDGLAEVVRNEIAMAGTGSSLPAGPDRGGELPPS